MAAELDHGERSELPQRGTDVGDLDDLESLGYGAGVERHDGPGEAEPGCLGETLGDAGDPSDLAGQAHFADGNGAEGQWPVVRS